MNLNMKRCKLILILVLLYQISFGQYKSTFGESTTKWNLILFGACDAITTTPVSVIGDSVFNGHNYKIIDRFSLFDESTGFLREDTITGKVWFYNKTINKEILVMDLSLNKTDSFKIYSSTLDSSFIYVDSVFFVEGIKHIRFKESYIHICAPDETFEFIEGTGSNAGLFYNSEWVANSLNFYLLCHEKDGIKVYGNKLYNDSCFVVETGIESKSILNNELNIFPNPTKGIVTIKFQNTKCDNFNLLLFNSKAQITHSISSNSNEFEFSLNERNTHINFFILKTNNRVYNTGKIIKL